MADFEVVERPAVKPRHTGLTAALRETAVTGKAIRLPRNQDLNVRCGVSAYLRKEGLRVRTRRDGDWILAWAERIESEPTPCS